MNYKEITEKLNVGHQKKRYFWLQLNANEKASLAKHFVVLKECESTMFKREEWGFTYVFLVFLSN